MTLERDFKGVWIPKEIWQDQELGWSEKILLVEIDSLAKNGQCFATNEYFAKFLGVHKKHISRLISNLAEKGYVEVSLVYKPDSKQVDKRIIHVPSGNKNVPTPPQKCSDPRNKNVPTPRNKNVEDKSFVNNTDINNTMINTTNIIKKINKKSDSAELESEFESLWKKYPRKIGRAKALQSFIKARNAKKYTYETIEIGLNSYIEYIEDQGTEDQFIAHFSTWLNQERFNDSYVCTAKKKPNNVFEFMRNEFGGENFERTRNGNIIDYDTTDIPKFF